MTGRDDKLKEYKSFGMTVFLFLLNTLKKINRFKIRIYQCAESHPIQKLRLKQKHRS